MYELSTGFLDLLSQSQTKPIVAVVFEGQGFSSLLFSHLLSTKDIGFIRYQISPHTDLSKFKTEVINNFEQDKKQRVIVVYDFEQLSRDDQFLFAKSMKEFSLSGNHVQIVVTMYKLNNIEKSTLDNFIIINPSVESYELPSQPIPSVKSTTVLKIK